MKAVGEEGLREHAFGREEAGREEKARNYRRRMLFNFLLFSHNGNFPSIQKRKDCAFTFGSFAQDETSSRGPDTGTERTEDNRKRRSPVDFRRAGDLAAVGGDDGADKGEAETVAGEVT